MKQSLSQLFPFILLLFSVGSGCTTIPKTHYYLLELVKETTLHAEGSNPGIEVEVKNFLVDPPYDQDRIVYRMGSGSAEVGFYAYHRWAVPLSHMLPKLVADSFSETPGITSIVPSIPGRPYSAILDGRLLSLEEIDTPEGHQVRVQMILTLRLRDESVIWSEALNGEAMTETSTVGAVVEKMREALAVLLAKSRESLASALLKMP